MLRAVSLDFWDTLYDGGGLEQRAVLRRSAVRRLVRAVGGSHADDAIDRAYRAGGLEAERWWREARGYTADERIRWTLARLGIERPDGCAHVQEAMQAVDDALLAFPPALLPGAADGVRALARRWPLAIVSDTGFASGQAQDRLLARDGLLDYFAVRVYSCDVGHSKPHAAPFGAATRELGIERASIVHVGDIERTDVAGALAAGFRAARLDAVRDGGPSAAEVVVRSWPALLAWLGEHPGTGGRPRA